MSSAVRSECAGGPLLQSGDFRQQLGEGEHGWRRWPELWVMGVGGLWVLPRA